MEWVKLGDVCIPKQWKTVSKKDMTEEGYPLFGANGQIGYYSEYSHIEETICITCRGATSGQVNMSLPYSYINGNAMTLNNLNEKIFDKWFLFYYFKYRGFEDVITGSAQPQIIASNLSKILLPVINLCQQNELVENIRLIESLISTRKAQIAALDELVQSVFYEMFGDVDDSKFATDIFKNLTSVNQGLQIAKSKRYKEYVDNSYEYITIQYLNGKKDREYVVPKSENVICNKEDILVTRTGNTGQIVTGVEGVFHNNFFKVNYNKALLLKEYLYYFLNLKTTQSRIKLLAGTSTIPDLNHGDFYSIEIPLPPIELQKQFAAKVEAIEVQKAKLQASLEEMETLFDALMQEAFSGNLG